MKVVLFFALFITMSCKKEKTVIPSDVSGKSNLDKHFNNTVRSMKVEDDFADLKKENDEGCEDEEKIEEKLTAKKEEVFKLQGGDEGCDIDAEVKH